MEVSSARLLESVELNQPLGSPVSLVTYTLYEKVELPTVIVAALVLPVITLRSSVLDNGSFNTAFDPTRAANSSLNDSTFELEAFACLSSSRACSIPAIDT